MGEPVAVMVEEKSDIAAFASYKASDGVSSSATAAEPARALSERPDYRTVGEQAKDGIPNRNSRGPTSVAAGSSVTAVSTPAPPGSVTITVRDAINKALEEEMARDEKVDAVHIEEHQYSICGVESCSE